MVVNQINLRIDDVHNRQDNADVIVETMRKENGEFNAQIVTAMNEQTVAFSEIKTKQTIYVSIAVFAITLGLNIGIDSFKSYPEEKKREYYEARVSEADSTKQLRNELAELKRLIKDNK